MKITVIGVVPPCPRCQRIYDLAVEVANELGIEAGMRKIAYDSEEAQRYGKVGTSHDIAEWANMEMDWCKIREIVSEGWSKELDDFIIARAIEPQEQSDRNLGSKATGTSAKRNFNRNPAISSDSSSG